MKWKFLEIKFIIHLFHRLKIIVSHYHTFNMQHNNSSDLQPPFHVFLHVADSLLLNNYAW